MASPSGTQELIGATQWLFDFFTGWFVLAAAGAYRLLLLPATIVAAGGEDFTTELGLANASPPEDRNRENLATNFKIWLLAMVVADLFFALSCGSALWTILVQARLLGVAILLQQMLLVVSLIVYGLGVFRDDVGDYTFEGDRIAIDAKWNRQGAQIRLGSRGMCLWLVCMFATTVWLFILGHSNA
jgi:hypothetical protein